MAPRLTTRISKLETSKSTNELTAEAKQMLVGILARRDALLWPWRWCLSQRPPLPEIYRRQREYRSGTSGIPAKADGREKWKDAHALRQILIAAGHISATHSGGQVQSVFLTALGEATARALVGDRLHTFDDAQALLAWLRILSERTPVRAVRESVLFGQELTGCPNSWDHLTEMILPLLTSGHVIATSDTQGRACYTPTDCIDPETITADVEANDDLDALYVKMFNGERSQLAALEPRDPSELVIPMPATGWGWPCHFPKDEIHDQK